MQRAELILDVYRQRGSRGLPVEGVYRQLFNPDLYLRAYGRIYRNDGAMTPGVTGETVDGMSRAKIDAIIADLRAERYRWAPVRRVEIPKRNGKMRPLGIPTWQDKLLQEVVRSLLDAYYEPQFSDSSHGFRPGRGCHSALTAIAKTWAGTKWIIEGDIKGCFDNIDRNVLLPILRESIPDNRFLRLVDQLLQAGYVKDWKRHPTFSDTPQGGIVSPILSNIYLDRLDRFVEQTLIPEYTRGTNRSPNPAYVSKRYEARRHSRNGRVEEAVTCRKEMRRLPSRDPNDPGYRRLRYVRYADDFLLGFIGPKEEAEEIKVRLARFLRETLKLELSAEKTLVSHATKQGARFLGYEVVSQQCDTKMHLVQRAGDPKPYRKRAINSVIALRLPADVVERRCSLYMRGGKPIHRAELEEDSDFSIVAAYQSEYRGYVEFYALAQNIGWLNKLRWVMEVSLLKTLAGKYRTRVAEMSRRYRAVALTEDGPRSCLEVRVEREGKAPLVARFGGLLLRRKKTAVLVDRMLTRRQPERSELLQRLLANRCEICKSAEDVQVHHVRKLADLEVKGRGEVAAWKRKMASRRRKTLVLCRECHATVHAGRPTRQPVPE
ncbi:reverse transcriptase/maturase family protein [Fimbriiglobus ruber]|uniref:Retron-type RNA-directed DNA polymerase n=1 Tax=Fimbriiglobus ruber TaxID=1908690 RepID=A0A225DEU5_9BACT|nr:reverse transcriptase/maturase family protein [Fimbriiglobus ruber]OWK39992.1 Retron-type RNA-directed DNA polymerase [Fimbriiglobus ruber]